MGEGKGNVMKVRYIAGIYTLIIFIVAANVVLKVKKEENATIDMVHFNEQFKRIEAELEKGNERKEIENSYQCEILYLEDEDYESRLVELIQSGSMILDYYRDDAIYGKIAWQIEGNAYQKLRKGLFQEVLILCVMLLFTGYFMLVIIYFSFIRPFKNLQQFSSHVAKGNLDMPLKMQRNNFFGAFTESFDIMREELKRARESEYAANVSKKELVAELSHDIKTPVATIKATCEVIEVKEKNPDILEKVAVISNKAEMINHLVGNMFHATLEELQALKVEVTEESSLCIEEMFLDLKYYGEMILENSIPECLLYMDKLRLEQVVDNIVNNSFKYAKTAIYVSFEEKDNGIYVTIRDKGPGVPEEELILVKEKFYRGSNTKGKSGSGLGLYLAENFMSQMQGGIDCYNEDGFVTVLFLRKV
ncbi:MAG: HAMP domain-containing histidine kinase [Lachnospiraceae bacterium]|nr:HAMP domain-containing histidine kinase [Lachnospiraceae bacterium]